MIETDMDLGDYVENKLTNTEGYVDAIADHLTGCTRVGVRSRSQDPSEHHDTEFYYPDELTVISAPSTVDGVQSASIPDEPTVEPGHIVEDDVTGIRGLAAVVTYRIFNCPQVCVLPEANPDSENTEYSTDGEWIDAPRLTVDADECVGDYEIDDIDDPQSTGVIGASKGDETMMRGR